MQEENKKFRRIPWLILPLMAGILLTGCGYEDILRYGFSYETYDKASVSETMEVKDNKDLYEEEFGEPVLYLTVGREKFSSADDHSFAEVNSHDLSWYEARGIEPYQCDALVQFGDEEGPKPGDFGYGKLSSNARLRLSGVMASTRQQKSYKIKINSGSGSIDGARSFVLSKSFADPLRFTNKLCYDLYSETDGALSVRTGFVHLYVKDESLGSQSLFVDYGLYTMTESVGNRYLTARNLSTTGELYELNNFDFARHEDVIMEPTEPFFDEKRFEELLESETGNEHTSLIAMLNAVNDESMPIEEVVESFFDKKNLYTFMAFNILVGNRDTGNENCYIYSPPGTDRFYFIPWDNEGAFRKDYELMKDPGFDPGYEKGAYIYSGTVLFDRILKSRECRDDLSEYVDILHETVLSPEHVSQKAGELAARVKPMLYSLPDRAFARVTDENYDLLLEGIGEQLENNYYAYYDSLRTPTPFHIHEPVSEGGKVAISWDESWLPDGEVTYDVEVSDSWDFKKVLASGRDLDGTDFNAGALIPGQYFVRVTAESLEGLTQGAYEYYNTEKETVQRGVMCFYVFEDGAVHRAVFQEE